MPDRRGGTVTFLFSDIVATELEADHDNLRVSQRLSDRWSEHFAHHFLADVALIEGDIREAQRRYRPSLEAAWQSGDQLETCYELQGMAMAASGAGDGERALRLASAASTKMRELGLEELPPFWGELLERHVAHARSQLGAPLADSAWRSGSLVSLAAVVEEALSVPA